MPISVETRRKMIREVLDSDRNINKTVMEINRKALGKYDEDIQPTPTDDQPVLTNIDSVVEKLIGILQNKQSQIDTIPINQERNLELIDFKTIQSQILEASKVDDIITLYNSIVRVRLEPTTIGNQSRLVIDNKLANIQKMVVSIYERMESIIVAYIKQFNASPNIHDKTSKTDNAFMNLGRGVSKLIRILITHKHFHILQK